MKEPIKKFKLIPDDAVFVVVDVQERLAVAMGDREDVVANIQHLGVLARDLAIPVVVTEQYPKGLGKTVAELADLSEDGPLEKITFSCCGEPGFLGVLGGLGRGTVILVGMETHVCVLQTALDLLGQGWNVHVVADAVTSRTTANRDRALAFLADAGCVVTVTETVLFQLMERAGTEIFKKISKRIK